MEESDRGTARQGARSEENPKGVKFFSLRSQTYKIMLTKISFPLPAP